MWFGSDSLVVASEIYHLSQSHVEVAYRSAYISMLLSEVAKSYAHCLFVWLFV
jgi:hypothetical protein